MYLKKIEIVGFKSFAKKTVIDFLPNKKNKHSDSNKKISGITAIVGPNGSGKSNIADAVRWVMGEQSMKSLRGKRMEDVIFSGSKNKGKLNYAMVSLHFDNSDKKIPLDFSEVILRRKLFRNGESEYIINGSKVRLMDVVDLLAGAGVGKDGYSILNQGKSDVILNASPGERKMILEDAAGVKQYQIKKTRALKKMKTTSENLEQVNILLMEIEPHLRRLKRQAGKIQKRQQLESALNNLQENYYFFLWNDFQEKERSIYERKETVGNEMMRKQREVDKLNDFVISKSKELREEENLDKLRRKREKMYNHIRELEGKVMIFDSKLEIIQEKIKEQNVVQSILVDKDYIQDELTQLFNNQKRFIEEIKQIKKIEDLKKIRLFAWKIKEYLIRLRKDIKKGQVKRKKTTEQINKEKELKISREDIKSQKKRLQTVLNKHKKEINQIEQKINKEIGRDKALKEDYFKAENRLRKEQKNLSFLKDKFNEIKLQLAKVETRKEDLAVEIKNNLKKDPEKIKSKGEKINPNEALGNIFKLKKQLEQIGGIDPLVLEEYEETKKRYETLQQESEDLTRAVKSLKKVAQEMDDKIEKIFSKAFFEINREFSRYFEIIFGGGSAKLKKVKELEYDNNNEGAEKNNALGENKKDFGIDIKVFPSKKKISDLAMLSGGERSLTALALLFAIISYNPPPFIILDEVEAALDEANSIRFGRILRELSKNTQFIAITHNRETMRQANYLYGVAMGNDGVSKILSVKLG